MTDHISRSGALKTQPWQTIGKLRLAEVSLGRTGTCMALCGECWDVAVLGGGIGPERLGLDGVSLGERLRKDRPGDLTASGANDQGGHWSGGQRAEHFKGPGGGRSSGFDAQLFANVFQVLIDGRGTATDDHSDLRAGLALGDPP